MKKKETEILAESSRIFCSVFENGRASSLIHVLDEIRYAVENNYVKVIKIVFAGNSDNKEEFIIDVFDESTYSFIPDDSIFFFCESQNLRHSGAVESDFGKFDGIDGLYMATPFVRKFIDIGKSSKISGAICGKGKKDLSHKVLGWGPELDGYHVGGTTLFRSELESSFLKNIHRVKTLIPSNVCTSEAAEGFKNLQDNMEKAKDGRYALSFLGYALYANADFLADPSFDHSAGLIHYFPDQAFFSLNFSKLRDKDRIVNRGYMYINAPGQIGPEVGRARDKKMAKDIRTLIQQVRSSGYFNDLVIIRGLTECQSVEFSKSIFEQDPRFQKEHDFNAPCENSIFSHGIVEIERILESDEDEKINIRLECLKKSYNEFEEFLHTQKAEIILRPIKLTEETSEYQELCQFIKDYFRDQEKSSLDALNDSTMYIGVLHMLCFLNKIDGLEKSGVHCWGAYTKTVNSETGEEKEVLSGIYAGERTANQRLAIYLNMSLMNVSGLRSVGLSDFSKNNMAIYLETNLMNLCRKQGYRELDFGGDEALTLHHKKEGTGPNLDYFAETGVLHKKYEDGIVLDLPVKREKTFMKVC